MVTAIIVILGIVSVVSFLVAFVSFMLGLAPPHFPGELRVPLVAFIVFIVTTVLGFVIEANYLQ